ncbi:NADH-quinone oxidoreductase subunit L [Nakamurella antarctica]|uniref:NADH-quinone oxidoreductase subunit L n=1 Tax=Nakamurella antarctica TaxID=1902245 RepID=A0A3G8ZPK5_9ACTN|nr:NADH-quinone oxidoreductase subunit L [Nakamurella antarctica]AZI58735.1 NADH-quinone oxidoreductase subunit L [Nakamurella antarctica]
MTESVGAVAASGTASLAIWLVLLPFIGAVILLIGGRRLDRAGHLVAIVMVLLAFVLGVVMFVNHPSSGGGGNHVMDSHLFSWMPVQALQLEFGLRIDPLSLTFVLLITGVGSLIHIYSIGYMHHDAERRKFFAYLNLFVGSMLLLVLGNSFVALYAGWEGVGLASYLLIGFWSDRPSAASAAKKAFIMNRVGDVGLALAIFLMFKEMGTTSFDGVFSQIGAVAEQSPGTVTAIALLLLLGACGKSGQFPLQAWLPDAMEGPTPVSALIHAATMVTAGVYLIARCAPIYNLTADGRLVVTIIGAITLLIGCIAGCAKDDIKKVLAYSTVSQIGYMFLAVGLGAGVYALGILHLLTHGFFKAGLFLGAGSVMHGMNDDVDMRRYGGLWKKMPVTFWTFTAGYLALIGFPFFSGYFSKDPIIEAAFAAGGIKGILLGSAALIGAGLTAFYMTRLMLMTFFGKPRYEQLKSADGRDYHPHESPASMTAPMVILAIGSAGAGAFLALGDRLPHWLTPSLGEFEHPEPPIAPILITIGTLVLIAAGVLVAYAMFGRRPIPVLAPENVAWPVRWARADVGGNALNEALFATPAIALTASLVDVEEKVVDRTMTGFGTVLAALSERARRTQTGYVRSYALSMLGGSLILVLALLAVKGF